MEFTLIYNEENIMIRFALMRDVKVPTRGTKSSAGIDVYMPKFDHNFIQAFNARNRNARTQCYFDESNKQIFIHPHGQVMIPLGIKVEIPENFALVAMNKSGVSFEQRINKLAELIDEDYGEEIFCNVFNYSEYPTTIKEGQKIIQLVLIPAFYDEIQIVPENEIHQVKGDRIGGMGSTGLY
jgi:dUTP pyrophosphatase